MQQAILITKREELKELFRELLEEVIEESFQPTQPAKEEQPIYLSTKEVRELFKIAPSTLISWGKKGILTPTKMGGRVYYLESEVMKRFKEQQQII